MSLDMLEAQNLVNEGTIWFPSSVIFFIIPIVKECHVVSGNLDYRSTQKWKRKSVTNDQPFWFILFSSWFQFSHSPLTINMSSLQMFHGSHHDFVHRYGLFVSQMTTNMFITILSFPHSLNHRGCNRSNTTCATCRRETTNPSGVHNTNKK